jgi:biotin synthase
LNNFDKILKIGLETASLDENQLAFLLDDENPQNIQKLFDAANAVKLKNIGSKVSMRGLIEIGNVCRKNCFYCGIRRDNDKMERFELSQNEILKNAELAWKFNYGSIVLQGGEIQTESHIAFIEDTVRKIKTLSNNELGITLSLGEQSLETFKRWFAAGAHRYLLRIETSNPEIYAKIPVTLIVGLLNYILSRLFVFRSMVEMYRSFKQTQQQEREEQDITIK